MSDSDNDQPEERKVTRFDAKKPLRARKYDDSDAEDSGSDDECIRDKETKKILELKKWDPRVKRQNKQYATLVMFAKRGSGKSFLLRHLLHVNAPDIPVVILICPTNACNKDYEGIIPDLFIFDEFDENTLKRINDIIRSQELRVKNQAPWMRDKNDNGVLIIMDDCVNNPKLFKSKEMRELFKMGRHFCIGVWLVCQYFNDFPIDLRENIDFCLILRTSNNKTKTKYQDFMGFEGNKQEFMDLLGRFTVNRQCIVRDMTCTNDNLQDNFFWYKADPVPKGFRINEEQWKMHEEEWAAPKESKLDWDEFTQNPAAAVEKLRKQWDVDPKAKKKAGKVPVTKGYDIVRQVDGQGNVIDI